MPLLYDWLSKAAKAQGSQKKALVYRDNYLSWRGLLERVDRRAQEFKAMGIKDGAWVGLMLGNVPDFVVLALALSKLGAAIVPIDPTTGARELELMLTAAPLRALVTRPRGSEGSISASGQTTPPPPTQPAASSPRPRSQRTTVPPAPGGGAIGAASAAGGVSANPEAGAEVRRRLQGTLLTCSVYKHNQLDLDVDPLAILFTSDSLGDPKAVLRSEKNTVAATDQAIAALDLDADSRLLVAVPLFHAYGWDLGLLPTLRLGATMYLEEELSARRIGKLIREHKIDVLPGTPHMYADLNRQPTAKKLEVENPRYLAAGSKLDPLIAEDFATKYGIKLLSCYHSTEASTIALDDTGKHPTSVGKPLTGVDVRVTGADGKPVVGKEGLVWVRSKALSPHALGPYDHEVGKTPASPGIGAIDKQGWFRSGDRGKLDKSGKLFLTGREDDVVKVEGKRVALGEVEGCLESFPKVKQAQALVIDDPLTGAMVIARVVPKSRCQPEEIIDHCARNLAPYKVPRRIEFCDVI
ncbi:MAG: acyl--CoA ligase [Myxococcales bacterium]|nr:acyl--CoA ligase [Myxococcales bacterium]MBK7194372.1 acyl--CoA ligase [Myxococcales bacterium]MBP6844472.1 acyl--CoA ligase [Kofleriaceae bacterium]